jgi:hypothetical protein
MVQKCLGKLLRLKLIEIHHSKEKYSTTAKGLEFLEKWTELHQALATNQPFKSVVRFQDASDKLNRCGSGKTPTRPY